MSKQKTVIAVLLILLVVALAYIVFDKWQLARQREVINVYRQGYSQGLNDTVTTLYQQTEKCQITTINLGNLTKQVVDVACLKQEAAAAK